jgi:hypothetical protein
MIFNTRLALLVGLSLSQECTPDLLVDDFQSADIREYKGFNRTFNKLGGYYGQAGMKSYLNTTEKDLTITAKQRSNYWYPEFNTQACFDTRKLLS